MKILLLDPAQRNGVPEMYENLGLSTLAATTRRAGFETDTLLTHVEGWSYRRLGTEIMRRQPDVLGVSLLSFNARKTLAMLRRLRAEGLRSKIVTGGHFPTFNDEILLQEWPELDVVVRGEGDLVLVDLLNSWQTGGDLEQVAGITCRMRGQILRTPFRPLLDDLDSLPWPVRDHTRRIIDMGGTLNVVRSRGCYGNCAFCSIASFYRSQGGALWRQRSINNVLAELYYLTDRFPGVEVKFLDDQFIGPGRRGWEDAMDFARAMIECGLNVPFSIFARADTIEPELFGALREAGLRSVFVGVESGSQRQLDACGKRTTVEDNKRAVRILHELDIRFNMGLIFFDPYTRMEDVIANLEYLHETKPFWNSKGNILSIENEVIVYKGTPFYNRLLEEGRLGGDYIDCTYTIPDWRVRYLRRISKFFMKHILPAISVLKLLPAHLRLLRIGMLNRLKGQISTKHHVTESAG